MSEATKAILLNKEVIAIDQDAEGRQALPITQGNLQMWVKHLADGSVGVGVVNRSEGTMRVVLHAEELHLGGPVRRARDLWKHDQVQFTGDSYATTVASHGILFLRVWRNGKL
jgi:alpha-galactosidase